MTTPYIMELRHFSDVRGSLGVVEGGDLPFAIRRLYYLYDVPSGAVRGEHGHKRLEQLILCLHGRAEIILNDGETRYPFLLERPTQGLYVPPGLWRSLHFRASGSVVCVLASRPYETEDYIYEFEDFLDWVRAGRPLEETPA